MVRRIMKIAALLFIGTTCFVFVRILQGSSLSTAHIDIGNNMLLSD